jgi:glycosyltransferase involved in cell wall biosynthesis
MRIAVNARMLSQRTPGGIGTYSYETLRRITDQHPEHNFIFIVDRPFPGKRFFPGNVTVVRTFPSFHPILWYPWFEVAVPKILKKHQADLFLSTDGFTSLSTKVPAVVVMHDLNFCHYPKDMPVLHRRYYNYFFPKYSEKAKIIATVSEYSKKDIVNLYHQPPHKITVTHNGISEGFRPLPEMEKEKLKQELTNGSPYFLYVGSLHPRKNLVRLIKAFEKFKDDIPSKIKLVLAGPKMFKTADIERTWDRMKYKDDVIFTGTVSPERLPKIYGGALALVFVSYFEGFGIPILEAMNCDIPVIASDRTAMAEVCGDAAYLVDPFSKDAIASAMKAIFLDEPLRSTLVERGRNRRDHFSWDRTADLLWECMERAMVQT